MRVAEICPTCATYINATCIIYAGTYLSTIEASPLDSLDIILENIDAAFTSQSGTGAPTSQIPKFVGQHYIDTNGFLWVGLSTGIPHWGLVGAISTTTTTTTVAPTTTTTTTV